MLVAGGYFRARLNIAPFDKILGGMCWSITGSAYDIDLEFEDDLTRGQKVELAEKVVASLQQMECPFTIFPHQISGCDYEALIKVIKWLLQKLKENRDRFLQQYEPGYFPGQGTSLTKCGWENNPLKKKLDQGQSVAESCEFNKEWLSDPRADYKCIAEEDFG